MSSRNSSAAKFDEKAFEILGIPSTSSVGEVDAKWRELRSSLHPDRPGGDADKFDQARKAYQSARFYALEPKMCPDCNGAGKVERSVKSAVPLPSFKSSDKLYFRCRTCSGRGQIFQQEV